MDFNAEGTKISLFQFNGRLVVLDVDSDKYLYKYNAPQRSSCDHFHCYRTQLIL